MEITNTKSADPLWPTDVCADIIVDHEPNYWEVDLKNKYFKNDTLTISEEAYAKIQEDAKQKHLDNSSFPSWCSELLSRAADNNNFSGLSEVMNAYEYAVRSNIERFKEENRITEDENGQRLIKRYMVEDDEILKEQFYTALQEKTTAGKALLAQHLEEKERIANGPQPVVDINNSRDFPLRMFQPF